MADLTPKDLNELASATWNLAAAQKEIATQAPKAAKGIDRIHDDAKRTHPQVKTLGDQLSKVLGAATPLGAVMQAVNDQLIAQAATARLAAEAMQAQAAAAERVAKAQAGVANTGTKATAVAKKSSGQASQAPAEQIGKLGGSISSAVLGAARGDWQSIITGVSGVVDVFATASAEGVGFKAVLAGLAAEAAPLAAIAAPIAIVGGLLAVGAGRALENEAAFRKFSGQLALNVDGLKYNAQGLVETSNALTHYGLSAQEARNGLQTFIKDGVDPSKLKDFSIAAENLSEVLGTDVKSAQENVSKAFTGNYDAVGKLDNELNFLTASQRQHIEEMFKAGHAAEAQAEAFGIFAKRVDDAAVKSRGPWQEATRELSGAWNDFVETLANSDTIQGVIALLEGLMKGVTAALKLVNGAGDKPKQGQGAGNGPPSALFMPGPFQPALLALQLAGQARKAETAQRAQAAAAATKPSEPKGKVPSEQEKKERAAREATGKRGPGVADTTEQAITRLASDELTARMALTQNIGELAVFKEQQIDRETKSAKEELGKDKGINPRKLDGLYATIDNTAALKKQKVQEDADAQLEAQRIQQKQTINGYYDQIAKIDAAMAPTLEKRNEIENKALAARQRVATEVLSSQLAQQVHDKKISQSYADAELAAQKDLQTAEERQQAAQQQLAIQQRNLTVAQAGRQNEADLLASRGALTTSVGEQVAIEDSIRKLRYDMAVAEQQAIIDKAKISQGMATEAKMAEDRIEVLTEINENDKKLAAQQHKLLNAYVAAIEAFSGMAKSVLDGDVGGTITGVSNTLSKASGLFKDSGISGALGSAGKFLGPVGSAVSAVTGVLGAIGQRSAEKAQAKLEGLKKGVEDLRTANMASSNSIAGALEEANKNWNGDLEYSSEMLTALRSIDSQIGALATGISQSIAAGKLMSTANLAIGKTGGGGLFGSSSNTELLDQGLVFNRATYGAIADGGLSGSTYADLVTTKTKKFLGVTTGVKVSTSTVSGSVDGDLLQQVSGVIQALGEGVLAAAATFGEEAGGAAKQALENAQIDIGKLSLKGLSSEEIEKLLNATFSKVGDDLAKAGVPGLEKLADVGEGAFETLIRLAREYEVVDTSLASIGKTFDQVGLQSLAARDALVEASGGLDAFTSQTAFFAEHFLTEDQRLKPVQNTVRDKLTELKLPTDMTREDFARTVMGVNVATKEGAQLYAALMALAPAFDKVATAAENAQKAVSDKAASIQGQIDDLVLSPAAKLAKSRDAEMKAVEELDASLVPLLKNLWGLQDAADAAKLATDQANMQADLMEAQGRTEEAKKLRRDLAVAAIQDPVQQSLQRQIWAAQDAAEKVSAARDVLTQAYQREHDAIQATKDKFQELSTSLRAFSASLTSTIAGADLATRYRMTRQTFQATASLARLGDVDAMGRLQADGEAFTAASRDYVSTSQDYLRDVGLVRSAVDEAADTADRQVSIAQRQLEALDDSVKGLIEINASVISVRVAIADLKAANQAAANAGVGSVGGLPTGAAGGAGKYGGLLADHSSDAASSDGQFVEGDLYDYDFHVELRRRLDAQMEANRAMGYDKWKEQQEATSAEGEAWLDSVWGGYPGAYREAMARMNGASGAAPDDRPSWTENDWRAGSGLPLLFANGGAFADGVVTRPTSFSLGLMGEAGPEAIMPLTRTASGALGVRAAGGASSDDGLINELRRLREELADLRATNARIATSNDKMERTLTNVTEGGRAMQTQAAA